MFCWANDNNYTYCHVETLKPDIKPLMHDYDKTNIGNIQCSAE
jgi:hypothetical protein